MSSWRRLEERAGPGGARLELLMLEDRRGEVSALLVRERGERPCFGGLRRRAYADLAAAREEVFALAAQMTMKLGLAGLPAGGAKAVMPARSGEAVPGPELERFGDAVESLGGRYVCGPDLGVGPEELARLRRRTAWVNHVDNDAGAATALGVLAAARAALRHRGLDPRGLRCFVQGAGSVGACVARGLARLGAEVTVADLVEERARALELEAPGAIRALASCGLEAAAGFDLVSPCALGRVLTREVLASIEGATVCGSANDQLAPGIAPGDAILRRVHYAPDFAVSVGAVLEGVLVQLDRRDEVPREIERVGERLEEIFAEAASAGTTPLEVALSRVGGSP